MRRPFLSIAALCLTASGASAVGFKTQLSCASDYYSYCSQHSVGTPELRRCMRANGPRLSKSCINALIEDGEISKAEVEREREKVVAARAKPKPAEPKKAEPKKADVAAIRKPQPAVKTTDVAAKKPALERPREKVTAVARNTEPAKPIRAAALPPEPSAPPVVRQTVSLDQPTFEALKNRSPHFVDVEDVPQPAIEPRRNEVQQQPVTQPDPPAEAARTASEPAAAADHQQAAGLADTERPERPALPEGRMSLGSSLTDKQPATWWDELVRAVTGE